MSTTATMIADDFVAYGTSRETIICGYCETAIGITHNGQDSPCFLEEQIANGELTREDAEFYYPNYYAADNFPIMEDSTVEVSNPTVEDTWDSIYANREVNFNGNYRDVEPTRCTHAVNWWTSKKTADYPKGYITNHGRYADRHMPVTKQGYLKFHETASYEQQYDGLDFEDPRLMRLEFNELQGFISSKLIDHDITAAYQYRFFNIYVGDRDGKLHIGLLTFNTTVDDKIQVTCKKCPAKLIIAKDATRKEQEDFIIACIRHGNNHGPNWLTNREDFAYIHSTICDTNHERNVPCNMNAEERKRADLLGDFDEAFQFLIDHRKFCTTESCRCTHYYHLLNERNYVDA